MANHMKFCGCRHCKRRSNFRRWIVRAVNKKFRKNAKEALKKGETPEPVIGVPYTD